jgi:hypothetical protein
MNTIETVVGTADVLHRLALAVETVDAFTRRPTKTRAGREMLGLTGASSWPCRDLETNGRGRSVLRHGATLPSEVTVRFVDPARRFVPRRLRVPLWTEAEVAAADASPPSGPYIPVRSRLLRPWLLPGPAYPLFGGTTAIRGRVTRAGRPVRWPRITARAPGDTVVGWAHGDERGEFLLVVTHTGLLPPPAPSSMDIDLVVSAAPEVPPTAEDAYGDLAVETVPRSAVPPNAADLDNDVLRGLNRPAGHTESTAPPTHVVTEIGAVRMLPDDIEFLP